MHLETSGLRSACSAPGFTVAVLEPTGQTITVRWTSRTTNASVAGPPKATLVLEHIDDAAAALSVMHTDPPLRGSGFTRALADRVFAYLAAAGYSQLYCSAVLQTYQMALRYGFTPDRSLAGYNLSLELKGQSVKLPELCA